jgi:hypothetical protein
MSCSIRLAGRRPMLGQVSVRAQLDLDGWWVRATGKGTSSAPLTARLTHRLARAAATWRGFR